jgi:hypothetical protein
MPKHRSNRNAGGGGASNTACFGKHIDRQRRRREMAKASKRKNRR